MNACAFCKNGKRKCDKTRPSCSNCLRLRKTCTYTEDSIKTNFIADVRKSPVSPATSSHLSNSAWLNIDASNQDTLRQSIIDTSMRILGSLDNIVAISNGFFIGTHQRISALSKFRFYRNLQGLVVGPPRASFATLCLCIFLVEQMPSMMTTARSPLYHTVKNIVGLLEETDEFSLDVTHCRLLVSYYEMGHGLHAAAYLSLAACARRARAFGLHRKRWRDPHVKDDMLNLEEEKRTWWVMVIMDRFLSLGNGDALFVTEDPERGDPLPIEDLFWSEASMPADLESLITTAPSLDTPSHISVGQLARECQVSHLVGRVVRHVFNPTPDPNFNDEEALQLERTLRSYIPLLSQEELKSGKFCGAFTMCNSSLYFLYEYMLSHGNGDDAEKQRILQSFKEISLGALAFSEATYRDRYENYPPEILSPFLPYSLCQAAIVQYRFWKLNDDPVCKQNVDSLKRIIGEFTKRWMVAGQYLEIIENLSGTWPSAAVHFQGTFISTGKSTP